MYMYETVFNTVTEVFSLDAVHCLNKRGRGCVRLRLLVEGSGVYSAQPLSYLCASAHFFHISHLH